MIEKVFRHLSTCTAILLVAMISHAIADTITTKNGETIRGTVRQFSANRLDTKDATFLVNVDGQDQVIPLRNVETITFEPRQQVPPVFAAGAGNTGRASTPRPPSASRAPDSSEAGGASHWLTTSSRKRHNSGCRYYQNSAGRPCGPNEGIPCKICGG